MVEAKNQQETSHWWWFDSHNKGNSIRSPWLQSTVAELDEKTKTMLKLIEQDADSFGQRAEMYYKKRPELISMVEDFYRTHRSLAERYDLIKSEPGTRLLTQSWSGPLSLAKHKLEKSLSASEKAYDSYSEAYELDEESLESEVDDPEDEEEEQEVRQYQESEAEETVLNDARDEEITRLREELERLREENKVQREELMQKDEEKREVIRQLSLAMDLLREEENAKPRHCITKSSPKKENRNEFRKAKQGFLERLFNEFTKSPANVVAV